MQIPLDAAQLLDREYLEIRAKILQLAASFDRLDRAEGSMADDPRIQTILQSLEVLKTTESGGDRAEQIQLMFSRPYQDDWQVKYDVPAAK